MGNIRTSSNVEKLSIMQVHLVSLQARLQRISQNLEIPHLILNVISEWDKVQRSITLDKEAVTSHSKQITVNAQQKEKRNRDSIKMFKSPSLYLIRCQWQNYFLL